MFKSFLFTKLQVCEHRGRKRWGRTSPHSYVVECRDLARLRLGEREGCRLRVCGKIQAEFSPRLNDKPLARVFKEQLRRIGRLRI